MQEDPSFQPKSLNPTGSWVAKNVKDEQEKQLVHKLHHRPEYELYDLQQDPYEMVNLMGDENQKVFNRLQKALQQKLRNLGDSDPITTEKRFIGKRN